MSEVTELGIKRVAIDKLHLDVSIRQRTGLDRVKELAESINETILIHKPRVRVLPDGRMVPMAGRDRIAAHLLLKRKHIDVELTECDDETARRIELEENLRRRRDPAEMAAAEQELLDMYTAQAEAEAPAEPEPAAEGAPAKGKPKAQKKSARGRAREKLAKAKGTKPESVRRSEQRRKAKEAKLQAGDTSPPGEPRKVPTAFNALGVDIKGEWMAEVQALRHLLVTTQLAMRPLFSALKKHAETYGAKGLMIDDVVRFADDVHQLAAKIRAQVPEALCPFCKGLEGVSAKCGACNDTCILTAGKKDAVPEELWLTGDAAVVYHLGKTYNVNENADAFKDGGKLTPISGNKPKTAPPPADKPKGGKKRNLFAALDE